MSGQRRVLAQARTVLAARSGASARTAGDTGYLIYLVFLTVVLVAVPAAVSIVRGVAQPQVLAALDSPGSYRVVAVVAALLAATALLLGRTRGAVVPSPFLTEFLVGSDLPRNSTLRRAFMATATVLAGSVVTVAGLVIGARIVGGEAASVSMVLVVFGFLAFAIVLAVLWLMGQGLPRRITVTLAVAVIAAGPLAGSDGVLWVTPGGWLAVLWQSLGAGTPVWWPAIALALSLLSLLAVPALLNNLRGSEIMAQSRRWQSIGTLVQTGDIAGASGALRDPPTRGRRIRIPLAGPLPWAILRRDLAAVCRFPLRIAVGSLALVSAGWLTATTSTAPDGLTWLTALAGASIGYLAVGVYCDGLRNAAENAGPGSMYGRSALTMIGCHSLLPCVAALAFGGLGVLVAGASGTAFPWWLLLAVFIVLVRVLDSAKGPMPITLLLPVPTPLGDVSILNAIVWQADALLIIVAVAGGLTVNFHAHGLGAAVWLALAAVGVAAGALRRIRALGA
ncbi:hypothetical protein D6T64_18720 [Cryobacterium melibiosiphilum]|uniref:Uncharacterized protein n=1 Tax=Cryobacterium melibiosiphilum TaxID=995039 RepID=A0A3A5MLN7_9MICO|nr:hypothetical protein [Cryobacterium melibiosiphilum]RJT85648.1 hypothetical protein D6T64_18720 [Cryobacterium melibiosiphilum]